MHESIYMNIQIGVGKKIQKSKIEPAWTITERFSLVLVPLFRRPNLSVQFGYEC